MKLTVCYGGIGGGSSHINDIHEGNSITWKEVGSFVEFSVGGEKYCYRKDAVHDFSVTNAL